MFIQVVQWRGVARRIQVVPSRPAERPRTARRRRHSAGPTKLVVLSRHGYHCTSGLCVHCPVFFLTSCTECKANHNQSAVMKSINQSTKWRNLTFYKTGHFCTKNHNQATNFSLPSIINVFFTQKVFNQTRLSRQKWFFKEHFWFCY